MPEIFSNSDWITDAFSVHAQVVIVTGASGAIGSEIAGVFGRNGARVVCSDRDDVHLNLVVDGFKADGLDVCKQPADLISPKDLKTLLRVSEERYGRIDAIINCDGIVSSHPIDEESGEDFEEIFHTNLRSVWLLIKHALAWFERAGGGAVVNIASVNGHRAQFPCSLYAGAKAAMLRMTQELAVELADRNIRVNSISPGTIGSFLERMIRQLKSEFALIFQKEYQQSNVMRLFTPQSQPLAMAGEPYDVAMAGLYLCSRAARFVTGADILMDGGLQQAFPKGTRNAVKFANEKDAAVRELRCLLSRCK